MLAWLLVLLLVAVNLAFFAAVFIAYIDSYEEERIGIDTTYDEEQ